MSLCSSWRGALLIEVDWWTNRARIIQIEWMLQRLLVEGKPMKWYRCVSLLASGQRLRLVGASHTFN